ncbi:MAG TPA: STAS domain-containing protein [Acidimicrobiales bacterium]
MNDCGSDVEPGADLLALRTRRDHEGAVVTVEGELDLSTGPVLEEALAALVDDPTCGSITVELDGLTFMDSTGLHVLVKAQNHLATRGSEIVLARPTPAVLRILDMAGVTSLFTIDRNAPRGRTAPS